MYFQGHQHSNLNYSAVYSIVEYWRTVEWLYCYLMSDVWANIARVPSTLYDNILVLVAVQQLECLSNLKQHKMNEITFLMSFCNSQDFGIKTSTMVFQTFFIVIIMETLSFY